MVDLEVQRADLEEDRRSLKWLTLDKRAVERELIDVLALVPKLSAEFVREGNRPSGWLYLIGQGCRRQIDSLKWR